jgi:hypothetical protein
MASAHAARLRASCWLAGRARYRCRSRWRRCAALCSSSLLRFIGRRREARTVFVQHLAVDDWHVAGDVDEGTGVASRAPAGRAAFASGLAGADAQAVESRLASYNRPRQRVSEGDGLQSGVRRRLPAGAVVPARPVPVRVRFRPRPRQRRARLRCGREDTASSSRSRGCAATATGSRAARIVTSSTTAALLDRTARDCETAPETGDFAFPGSCAAWPQSQAAVRRPVREQCLIYSE